MASNENSTAKKGQKRKRDQQNHEKKREKTAINKESLRREISAQLDIIKANSSFSQADLQAALQATNFLVDLAKKEQAVSLIVRSGAIPVLVKQLKAPPLMVEDGGETLKGYDYELEKASAFALGLLAVKPEFQLHVMDAGALPLLVDLLKRHRAGFNSRGVNGVIRRAADTLTNLAHENSCIKTGIRMEGGIPPLVELLESNDVKVQRAVAGALRTLAFKNDENKEQIVKCNALSSLILMLDSEDPSVCCEAVGALGNLVHSSPDIKQEVLLAGALQPVIGLLRSCCSESQKEAALLLGQFAATDSDCKIRIAQRGAIPPLIEMLQSDDLLLMEMSAFALGRLAQESHNQAGISHSGGLMPLLKLLDSKNGSLQHNAAFAVYGLADNEDNVAAIIKVGGLQKLLEGEFIVQATKDCIAKTLKRLEEKIHGRVLTRLLYLMRSEDITVQRRVVLALAHLCPPEYQKLVFIDNNGLDLLLELLKSSSAKQQIDGAEGLCKLASNSRTICYDDSAPPSPISHVYMGKEYVNNATLSDVIFLVQGKRFYAHRNCLRAASDAFRAMFDGGYREMDDREIEIPNIRWEIFDLMMRYIYTGSVHIKPKFAQDLFSAADQYLLGGLKRLCEFTIAQDISLENVSSMYELSEEFHAVSLKRSCILFILQHYENLSARPRHLSLVQHILPEIRNYLLKLLNNPNPVKLLRVKAFQSF